MKKGRLYCIGTGPGDKELITLKAVRILNECAVTAVPVMKDGERTAFGIIEDYIKDKQITECFMPMSRNAGENEKNYIICADKIEQSLSAGLDTALITLGDPSVYSSCMKINSIIRSRGYETETVPGVTSFCAAAARLNLSLCERDEPLIIMPASYNIEKLLDIKGTKVVMKSGRSETRDIIRKKGLCEKSVLIENCGRAEEKIYKNTENIKGDTSYFSLIIIKD